MRSPRPRPQPHHSIPAILTLHLIQRRRRLAALRPGGVFLTNTWMPTQRNVDHIRIQLQCPLHNRHITFFDMPMLELMCQTPMRRIRLRHDHHACGIAIQSMHNPRTEITIHTRKRTAVIHQPVHQSATAIAPSRMHHEVSLLVHHEQLIIFVQNIQGNIFAGNLVRWRGRQNQLDHITWIQLIAALGWAIVDSHRILANQSLYHVAREIRKPVP